MKKIYLLLGSLILLVFTMNAQVHIYEYDSKDFNEETIKQIVTQSRQKGVAEYEIQILERNLHVRLEKIRRGVKLQTLSRYAPNQVMQACTNTDFEQGNYNGWTLTSGDILGQPLPCNTCANVSGGIANVTTATNSGSTWSNGVDNCSGQPAVAPGGGNYSICLNDNSANAKIMKLEQTFQVNASNNIFTFQYLAVLEDGGHQPSDQPYFSVQMLDQNSNVISCTQDFQSASSSASGWTNSTSCSGVIYKGWRTVTIDLTSYIGQNVTMQYVVSDCNQGAHFGYVYLDGACGQLNYTNNAGICSGANAQLCGPAGYATYSWTGPATGNQQCLSTGTAGTYTLTTTSSLGCPSPVLTYTVAQSPAPTAGFSVATQGCSLAATFTDQSTGNGGTLSNWSWNFGDGQTATSTSAGNVQTHTYSASGTYTVSMTCTTTPGCVATQTAAVTLSPSLTSVITSTAVSCNGGNNGIASVTATGGSGIYSYTWSPSNQSTQTATNLAAGTYSVNINDGAGCTTTTVVTVSQPSVLSATSSSNPASCNQSNGSASVSPSGGTSPYTYTWSPSGGNGASAINLSTGNYTCNIADSKGCTTTATASVAVTAGPAITSATASNVTCNGGANGSATVNATGTGTLSYTWAPAGTSGSTASNLQAGSYTCTVADANGCTTSTVVAVSEPAAITTTASFTATACGMSNGAAEIIASGGNSPYTYSWTPINVSGSLASNLAAGTYTCNITDAVGCTKTVQAFITTSSGPSVTVISSTTVSCNGGNDGSAIVSVSGGSPAYTYTWSPAGGNDTTASNLAGGTYTFVVADQIGCVSTKTLNIAQPSAIVPTLTPTHLSCYNGTNGAANISLTGGTAPYTYTWSPGGSNSQTISNLTAGIYTCNVTDAKGCPNTYTIAINQPPQLNATPSSTSVTCSGASNGSAAVLVSGGTSPYTYSWSPTGGTNATAINLPGGVYNVTIHDNNNCPKAVTVTVSEAAPLVVTYTASDVKCFGTHDGSVTVNVTGGTGTPSYTWSPSGGQSSSATNLNPGTYTCSVQDQNGCTTFTTVTISQPTQMTVTTTFHAPNCSGGSNGYATVNANGGVGPYTYSWTTSPVQTTTLATNMASGVYTVTVKDQNGCPKKKTVTISTPEPKDTLTVTGVLCSTDPVVVLNAPSGGVAPDSIKGPYQWYDGAAGITGQTGSSFSAIQSNVNNYWVTWWYKGCRYKTKDVVETVYQDLFSMPSTNIFTPNADKANDEFLPFSFAHAGGTYTASMLQTLASTYELWVYDRWGKLMFHTTDITQTWDGKTDGGKDAPDGTYYWIARYKTHCNGAKGDQETKGFVQLIR